MNDWHVLCIYHEIFELAADVANLKIKPAKCNLVPLSSSCSLHVVSVIREFLETHIPAWSSFRIVPHAEYLGFQLGPAASEVQWTKPVKAFAETVQCIASSQVSTSVGIATYNERAVSKLSYKLQLLPPPSNYEILDKRAFARIWKAPFGLCSYALC